MADKANISWRLYWRRFWPQFRRDWGRAVKTQLAAGIVLALTALVFQWRYHLIEAPKIKANVFVIVWPYLGIAVLFALYHAVNTVSAIYAEDRAEISTLKEKAHQGLQLPTIEVSIDEVHVLPATAGGTVFISAKLHNVTPDVLTTVDDYRLEMEVEGQTYVGGHADLQNWVIDRQQGHDVDSLLDLSMRIHSGLALQRGRPVSGWLRFVFVNESVWGKSNIESGLPDTGNITKVVLVIIDAFSVAHRGSATPPWKQSGRIIFQLPSTVPTPKVGSAE